MLKMKIHLVRSMKVGNTMVTTQFTVADLVKSDTLYFRIPPVFVDIRTINLNPNLRNSDSYGLMNISYCVSAIDMYNAITPKCEDLRNMHNKMEFIFDYTQMVNYLETLNFTNNITNILYGSNIIF